MKPLDIGDTVVLHVGKGKRRKLYRITAVGEYDKLGRYRVRTKLRKKARRSR